MKIGSSSSWITLMIWIKWTLWNIGAASLFLPCFAMASQPLTFETLLKIVQGENNDHKKVGSIEELLPYLPAEYRENFVLIKQSKSRHQTHADHPRVILFGQDARFIMAYSGLATDLNYNSFETIEFDDQTKKFEFRTIEFNPGQEAKAVRTNERCISCHGTNPRPIWAPYRNWPVAYGAKEDTMEAPEKSEFSSFIAKAGQEPRYSGLELYRDANYGFRLSKAKYYYPNTLFTARLGKLNAQKVFQLMKRAPSFETYKYALLALSRNMDCVLPKTLLTQIDTEYKVVTGDEIVQRPLYQLFRLMGLNPLDEMRMDHSPVTPVKLADPRDLFQWSSGVDDLGALVGFVELKDLLATDLKLKDILKSLTVPIERMSFLNFSIEGARQTDSVGQPSSYMDALFPSLHYKVFTQQFDKTQLCNYLSGS